MLAKFEFILIIIFLTVLSIIAVGDFNIRLATEDYRLSGVSHAQNFLFSDIYKGTILENFQNLNFQILTIIPVYISKFFFIPLSYCIYVLTILGNIIFYFIFYLFSKLILQSIDKSFFTLLLFIVCGITYNNLSIMGTDGAMQVFPDSNIYAWSLILLSIFFIIRQKYPTAFIVLSILPFIHIGHFFLFSAFVVSYLSINIIIKLNYQNFLNLTFYSLFCIFILALFRNFEIVREFSYYEEFFFNHLKKSGGHTSPLQYTNIFPKVFISYLAIIIFSKLGYLFFSKKHHLANDYKKILIISLCFSTIFFLSTLVIPYYDLVILSKIWFLIPARASVYTQIFAFPLVGALFYKLLYDHKGKFIKYFSLVFIIISSIISSFGLLIINIILLISFLFDRDLKVYSNFIYSSIILFLITIIVFYKYSLYESLNIILYGPFTVFLEIFFNNEALFRDNFLLIFLVRNISFIFIVLIIFLLFTKERIKKILINLNFKKDNLFKIILILILSLFTIINSFQKMSGTIFDAQRKNILKTQIWINKNIDLKDKILTDQYIFTFSGITKHAIIYPSISMFLPFRIINDDIVKYQNDMEKITLSKSINTNEAYTLNNESIKKHDNSLNILDSIQIEELSNYHSANYFITKNEYEIFDLLFDSGTHKVYQIN